MLPKFSLVRYRFCSVASVNSVVRRDAVPDNNAASRPLQFMVQLVVFDFPVADNYCIAICRNVILKPCICHSVYRKNDLVIKIAAV